MQLTMDLLRIGHTVGNKLPQFNPSKESKAHISIAGCVFGHIIAADHLSDLEKLFYILANALAIVNLHGGKQRAIAFSAESWSERLNCAKSQIFSMQSSLEAKGYFIISRDRNKHGQNKRNLICPTLPDNVFKDLSQNAVNRVGGQELSYAPLYESKLQYLDRTKLFIILGYQVLKDVVSSEYLSPFHKLVWLDCYASCYKARVANFGAVSNINGLEFSFIASYQQLQDRYSCNKSTLSITLAELEELGLIKREHFYTRKEFGDQERQDKSLWKISLLSSESEEFDGNKRSGTNGNSKASNHEESHSYGINGASTKLILRNVLPLANKNLDSGHSDQVKGEGGYKNPYIDQVVYELTEDNKAGNWFDEIKARGNEEAEENNQKRSVFASPEESGLGANISSYDPDINSTSLYNIKNINIDISKSNLVNKHKTQNLVDNNIFFEGVNVNNKTSTTNCPKPTEKLNQYGVGGEAARITSIESVFRRENFKKENTREALEFNVSSLLIKERLKLLSKDKADKARKFAYSLFSKKLTKGYASTLSKHELAKQFIFHATSWKPTKIGRGASDDKLVDVALSVAWNAAIKGSWQEPLEWAKAKAFQYEFLAYKNKFKESGIISKELRSLESMVNNLLGSKYNLESIISEEVENKTREITKITEVQDDRVPENKQEEGRATGVIIQITIATTTLGLQHRLSQINQDALALYDLSEDREDSQIATHPSEYRKEQSTNNNLIDAQKVDRVGGNSIFRKNGDSTSIQKLTSQFASLQANNFQEHTFEDDKAFYSSPTDAGFLSNLLEQRVYLNLSGNSNGGYKSDLEVDNYQEYTARLKLMQINDKGELVITLQPDLVTNASPLATHEVISVQHRPNSGLELGLGADQDIIDDQEEDLLALSDHHLSKGFTKIDQALSGILKNFKRGS